MVYLLFPLLVQISEQNVFLLCNNDWKWKCSWIKDANITAMLHNTNSVLMEFRLLASTLTGGAMTFECRSLCWKVRNSFHCDSEDSWGIHWLTANRFRMFISMRSFRFKWFGSFQIYVQMCMIGVEIKCGNLNVISMSIDFHWWIWWKHILRCPANYWIQSDLPFWVFLGYDSAAMVEWCNSIMNAKWLNDGFQMILRLTSCCLSPFLSVTVHNTFFYRKSIIHNSDTEVSKAGLV